MIKKFLSNLNTLYTSPLTSYVTAIWEIQSLTDVYWLIKTVYYGACSKALSSCD